MQAELYHYDGAGPRQQYNYAYDYRGRRVARENSSETGYSWGVNGWVSAVFSGGTGIREYSVNPIAYSAWWMPSWNVGNTTVAPGVEYVRGSDWGGGVGGVLYSLHSDVPQYYHYDGRGDVVAQTTGSSGALAYQAAYNAYGEHTPGGSGNVVPAAPGTQEWSASGANTDDLRANTKEEDPTGLLYEGQRFRLIGTNTFLTPDPMGMVDGTNQYGYCRENPWSGFDPEGLFLGTSLSAGEWFGAVGSGLLEGADRVGGTIQNYPIAAVKSIGSGYAQMGELAGKISTGEAWEDTKFVATHQSQIHAAEATVALQTGKQVAQSLTTPEGLTNASLGLFTMAVGGGVLKAAPDGVPPILETPKPVVQTTIEPPATNAPAAEPSQAPVTAPVDLHRPYIRDWVRADVEAAAERAPDGRFIDPNTGLPTDDPVLGHKEGYEFWRLKKWAQEEKITQAHFNETLNNPEFYQIEDKASNASHAYEQK